MTGQNYSISIGPYHFKNSVINYVWMEVIKYICGRTIINHYISIRLYFFNFFQLWCVSTKKGVVLDKIFVKAMFVLKKKIKVRFHEIFHDEIISFSALGWSLQQNVQITEIYSHAHTLAKISRKYLASLLSK